jgi:hypothetical protein
MGYKITHVIEDPETGKIRPLRKKDLDYDRHPGVRAAFKVVYEMQKHHELRKGIEK